MEKKQFVLLASQRTGSNAFNQNINQFPGVLCHNEVFNPSFVGLSKNYLALFGGEDQARVARDTDPLLFMYELLRRSDMEFVGFHLFPGHIKIILDTVLADLRVKKICLRRNLFQSYVSLRIAQQTNVWLVRHAHSRVGAIERAPVMVEFDVPDFERYENNLREFWRHVLGILQETGQECFNIWYSQINDIEVLNRCAEFLGVPAHLDFLKQTLKKQNPVSLVKKVSNFAELEKYARSRGLEKHLL